MDVFANGISVLNKFHYEQVGIRWIQFGRLTTAPFCPHVLKNIPLVKIKSNILQPFFFFFCFSRTTSFRLTWRFNGFF